MTEIYFSTDVETDGPIPGPHSMLSLASAAFNARGEMLATFTVNLQLLEGSRPDPDTMAFWEKNQEAYQATRQDTHAPETAMGDYVAWVERVCLQQSGPGAPAKAVFVAYPAGFDFLFVYWYMIRFVNRSPFSFSALDIKSFAMALLGRGYRECTKKEMPKRWRPNQPHTHVAIDDAIEQGMLFCNMLKHAQDLRAAIERACEYRGNQNAKESIGQRALAMGNVRALLVK